MELALFHMVQAAGAVPEQRACAVQEKGMIPFDSARKRMTTIHEVQGEEIMFVKGAPDVLLERCTRIINPAGADLVPSRQLSASDRAAILNQNQEWSLRGLRILAFAWPVRSQMAGGSGNRPCVSGACGNDGSAPAGVTPASGCGPSGRNTHGDDHRRSPDNGNGCSRPDRHFFARRSGAYRSRLDQMTEEELEKSCRRFLFMPAYLRSIKYAL